MDFQIVCQNVDTGCGWRGALHDLEHHVASCAHRQAHCLYCRAAFPLNLLPAHTEMCLSDQFQDLLKMEESVSITIYQKPKNVECPNADKNCMWLGQANELKAHLYECKMEEYRPADSKRRRFL